MEYDIEDDDPADVQQSLDFNVGAQRAIEMLASDEFLRMVDAWTGDLNGTGREAFISVTRELVRGHLERNIL